MRRLLTNRRRALAAASFCAVTACACTTLEARYGEPLPTTQATLQEDMVDVGAVIAVLGPPARISALPDGMVMLYEYVAIQERQLGINLEFLELDILKMSMGRAQAQREALALIFDSSGTLRARQFRAWEEDVGRGGSIQLFFVALPTVDSRHLRQLPEQLTWGRAGLEPLPVTLNSANSVTTGAHGVEMNGTPSWAGQHTLEMSAPRRRP